MSPEAASLHRPPKDPEPDPRTPPWLVPVLGLALALGLATAGAVAVLDPGPRPPFLASAARSPAPPARPPVTARSAREPLRLAGSGSNLPLMRKLADAFAARSPDRRLVVHESIGSTGGVRAVRDGAIDLGLISRPLRAEERALGLHVLPYARVAVVVAANPAVPERDVTSAALVALYEGRRSHWSDGSTVVVLEREHGDSSHQAVAAALPAFGRADEQARRAGRWRVLYTDGSMQEALLATRGAVGLLDRGAIVSQTLPLAMLSVAGVAPSDEAVAAGRYPFVKDLAFVAVAAPTGLAAELVDFVYSPAAQRLMRQAGYLPLARVVP